TRQLAELIERISPRHGRKAHPATKVFQALRIAVNDEIGSLKRGLEAAMKIFGRAGARDYTFAGGTDVPELREPRRPELKIVTRKAIAPGEAELAENIRSRSAQLRVFEKT